MIELIDLAKLGVMILEIFYKVFLGQHDSNKENLLS